MKMLIPKLLILLTDESSQKEAYVEIQEDSDQNPCYTITCDHCGHGYSDDNIRNAELQTDSRTVKADYARDTY